ncbi:MAG: ABC transporter ATP-binding protein [Acutalibacteraceae bacterium]
MSILEIQNVAYSYDNKKNVFSGLNFTFDEGKMYAVMGKSGAGKTTLLSLLSGLCEPTQGRILVDGEDISKRNKYKYRSQDIGIIFQSFNLLPKLTALENVEFSMEIAGLGGAKKRERAKELLEQVGLDECEINRRVLKLSGGQQQRVAIARALSYNPKIILADEPTGNLDVETQQEIMDIFEHLAHDEGKCIVIVTHSPDVAKQVDCCYTLTREPKKA